MNTTLRPADRCLITGQPMFCPECGRALGDNGCCTSDPYWTKCSLAQAAELGHPWAQPYPDYAADEPPMEWQHIPKACEWAEGPSICDRCDMERCVCAEQVCPDCGLLKCACPNL